VIPVEGGRVLMEGGRVFIEGGSDGGREDFYRRRR
jgi:hypothetical protein